MLSDAFYDKIDQFNQVYQDVNQYIKDGGKDSEFDLNEKEKVISERIEE